VVPGKQNLRDRQPPEFRRARILRVFEQPRRVRLVDARFIAAEHARQQPDDRIGHHHRRKISAGQDEIAQRKLPVDRELNRSFINSLVVAGDHDQMLMLRQLAGGRLRESLAPRGSQDHHASGFSQVLHRLDQRLDLHQHPRTAAVRFIIHRAAGVIRIVPQIDRFDPDQVPGRGAPDDALAERSRKHLRKQRHDIDPHDPHRTVFNRGLRPRPACAGARPRRRPANGSP